MSRKNNRIYCNCCGGEICPVELEMQTSYLAVNKVWGYFSDNRDGEVHRADICEPCCRKLAEAFVIPPDIGEITEYL